MDNHTPEQRRKNMQAIRSKDTDIEVMLRKELWRRGLRYRKNVKTILGKPDIAFIGLKVVVYCDGEYWHGYHWQSRKNTIKTNRDYWIPKIERNMKRDKEVTATLESAGWTVIRFWEHDIQKDCSGCADVVEREVNKKKSTNG